MSLSIYQYDFTQPMGSTRLPGRGCWDECFTRLEKAQPDVLVIRNLPEGSERGWLQLEETIERGIWEQGYSYGVCLESRQVFLHKASWLVRYDVSPHIGFTDLKLGDGRVFRVVAINGQEPDSMPDAVEVNYGTGLPQRIIVVGGGPKDRDLSELFAGQGYKKGQARSHCSVRGISCWVWSKELNVTAAPLLPRKSCWQRFIEAICRLFRLCRRGRQTA